MRLILNKQPSQTNNEERKRERKAIFDKYRKKEEIVPSTDNNIVVAFEEIFKRKGDKHAEGATIPSEHHQPHPFGQIARPEEYAEQQRQRPPTRIFEAKPPLAFE